MKQAFKKKAQLVNKDGFSKLVFLDFVDGEFVPEATFRFIDDHDIVRHYQFNGHQTPGGALIYKEVGESIDVKPPKP